MTRTARGVFDVDFDFVDHRLRMPARGVPLRPMPVAEFQTWLHPLLQPTAQPIPYTVAAGCRS